MSFSRRSYPAHPIPAVGAFIVKNGKLLMIRRAYEPSAGKWSVPGGIIEVGESALDALRREVKEELGIEVKVIKLLDIYDCITKDEMGKIKYHYLIIGFLAHPISLEITPSSEVLEYSFFDRDEVERIKNITSSVKAIIEKHSEIFESG